MHESVSQIRAAAESGSALTRQLLGFARKQVVSPQVVGVNALVRRLPPLLRRLVGESVDLETTLDPLAGNVRVDPAQLDQVLMNLAVNAMDAMPAGGRLQIATLHVPANDRRVEHSTVAPGPLVEIIVRDTGHGMSEDVRTRAFEPFFTTKAQGKGTGLGLATSYGIITQAGGSIFLDSAVGRGTSVRIVLPETEQPLAQPLQRSDADAGSNDVPTGTETILAVDDDSRVRRITAESLRRFGYQVLEAESGLHALETARREPGIIHLLVTDVVMPGMSGRVLADALLRERPSLRVLYVSGYTGGALEQHGLESADVELLEKPYDRAELARRVRRVLDSSTPALHA
jgi:two-component system, cell cycle sensor histidine kinase and response regulator CckA